MVKFLPEKKIEDADILGDASHVLGHNASKKFGRVPVSTFATALQGERADLAVQSIEPGFGIQIVATDPKRPILTVTGGVGAGSVISVGLSAPTGFSVSGSPVTVNGTLSLTYSAGYEGFQTSFKALINSALQPSNTGTGAGQLPVLDVNGKLLTSILPDAVFGGVNYQGGWNATTNTPTIPTAAAANKGWYYIVTTAGTTSQGGITDWQVGDWIISNGASWGKVDSSDQVNSVAGLQGTIPAANLKTALAYTVADITDMSATARTFNALTTTALMFANIKQAATTGASGVVTFATSAQYRNNTTTLALSTDQVWGAAVPTTVATMTGTVTLDFSTFINHIGSFTGNVTLGQTNAVTTPKPGQMGVFEWNQDSTGGRTLSVNSTYWALAGGTVPAISTAANAKNRLAYYIQSDGKVLLSLVAAAVA